MQLEDVGEIIDELRGRIEDLEQDLKAAFDYAGEIEDRVFKVESAQIIVNDSQGEYIDPERSIKFGEPDDMGK